MVDNLVDIPPTLLAGVERAGVTLRDAQLAAFRSHVALAAYLVRHQWPTATAIMIDASGHNR